VFDHPYFELTGPEGRFKLANVPPGEYRLEVAHPAGELYRSQPIRIGKGEAARVDVVVSPDHLTKGGR